MWLSAATLAPGKISIVHTRASRYERHRRDAVAFLQTVGLPVCKTVLHARSAYVYASTRGTTVTDDDPNGLAAAEIRQLCHEYGWVNDRPSRAVRDRRRTKDDLAYFRASMKASHLPTELAQARPHISTDPCLRQHPGDLAGRRGDHAAWRARQNGRSVQRCSSW